MADYFYSGQTRRFLLQFSRIFSHFEVEYGLDASRQPTYIRVPIRYGDASTQAQTILQENSANNIPVAPLMTFYITDFSYDRDRIQAPTFVDRTLIRQREWNESAQDYDQTQGTAFKIERPMPIPQMLSITLDIWTTNTHMKFQLLEQIKTLFNPALEIQSTDNALDWSSLSTVDLVSENWSSRSVPNGANSIDIASMKFKIPIWISPPARVTTNGFIHKIVSSAFDDGGNLVDAINNDDLLMGTRLKVTPHGYKVLLIDGKVQILPEETPISNDGVMTSDLEWDAIIDEYGKFNEGITQLRFENEGMEDIVGTVTVDVTDPSMLNFDVDTDTLPSNTLPAVDAIINPLISGPESGLAAAAVGQRYLLTDATGDIEDPEYAEAWGGSSGTELVASADDIIEYDGTKWIVSYDDSENTTQQYVTNIVTGVQYKTTEAGWIKSYYGIYDGGSWAIIL